MSCPYFYPEAPRSLASSSQAAMLPLGDEWTGICRAASEPNSQPDAATVRGLCNLGYARGSCGLFPIGDGPDAVRFTICSDDGATLRLYYVMEQNHHPFAHGSLAYSRTQAAFAEPPADHTLCGQAQAYVNSYLRRKSSAVSWLPASTEA